MQYVWSLLFSQRTFKKPSFKIRSISGSDPVFDNHQRYLCLVIILHLASAYFKPLFQDSTSPEALCQHPKFPWKHTSYLNHKESHSHPGKEFKLFYQTDFTHLENPKQSSLRMLPLVEVFLEPKMKSTWRGVFDLLQCAKNQTQINSLREQKETNPYTVKCILHTEEVAIRYWEYKRCVLRYSLPQGKWDSTDDSAVRLSLSSSTRSSTCQERHVSHPGLEKQFNYEEIDPNRSSTHQSTKSAQHWCLHLFLASNPKSYNH